MKDLSWLLGMPIAHRGFHSPQVPENSMAAFRDAIHHGFSIELDVRKTRDDVLVAFHDDTLRSMTGCGRAIGDSTSSELHTLVLAGTMERIPVLADVLDMVNGQAGLLIEIKMHPGIGSVEGPLAGMLDRYPGEFAVVSFDPRILHWFLQNRPGYIRGQISGGLRGKKFSVFWRFLMQSLLVCLVSRPDFIAYEYPYITAWVRFFTSALRIPLIAWTIRDAGTAAEARHVAQNIIFEGFFPKDDESGVIRHERAV